MRHLRISVVALCLSLLVGVPTRAGAPEPQKSTKSFPLEQPRYKQNPVYILFESYILDVIGHLPEDRSRKLQSMNLQKVFKTKASEWRSVLRETLALSSTIDVAILDLWYRNQDLAKAQAVEYTPEHFAVSFTDEYIKDGSQVDVWPSGALEAAKARIEARRAAR
jgi:hypothetical protein